MSLLVIILMFVVLMKLFFLDYRHFYVIYCGTIPMLNGMVLTLRVDSGVY
jgi:hypothetical protein